MTQAKLFVQETASIVQAQVDLLDKCLHSPNSKDELLAECHEIANCKGISVSSVLDEMTDYVKTLEKIGKYSNKIKEKLHNKEIPLLEVVKFNFLLKEVVEVYWYFVKPTIIRELTDASVSVYKVFISNLIEAETPEQLSRDSAEYVILESLKHALNALLKAGLQKNVFSKVEISNFNLGDITTQESEDVILFLSTKMKWQPTYDALAKS